MPHEHIEELALEIIREADLRRIVVGDDPAPTAIQGAPEGNLPASEAGAVIRVHGDSVETPERPERQEQVMPPGGATPGFSTGSWGGPERAGRQVHLLRVCSREPKAALADIDWRVHRPWIVALSAGTLSAHETMQDAEYGFVGAWGAEWIYVARERAPLAEELAEIISTRRSATSDDAEMQRGQIALLRRQEADTRRNAHARIRELEARIDPAAGSSSASPVEGQIPAGSLAWRLALGLQRVGSRVPAPARRAATRALRAAWWFVTPHRYGERVRYLRSRRTLGIAPPAAEATPELLVGRPGSNYADWIASVETRSPLARMALGNAPCVTFLLQAEGATPDAMARTLRSVKSQSRADWELVVCGADSELRSALRHREPVSRDPRIRWETDAEVPLTVAFSAANGAFVALLRAGEVVAGSAVNELACVLERNPGVQVAYSDEDALDGDGRRCSPVFKPGWSPDLLFAYDYFGRLSFLRRELVKRVGGFQPEAGAALEWDLHLRCSDVTQDIVRIPKVLCHRPQGQSRERPGPSSAASADHRDTLARHWRRHGFEAVVISRPDGTQQTSWTTAMQPLVSVIIPTKDKVHLLRTTMQGLLHGTDYARMEVVIVDTGSQEAQTHAYYEELATRPGVRIVRFEKRFNYSAACNYGASCAKGELLLFLNNDIEVVERGWMAEMVRFAQRPGVGVVGTRLDYPTGELQHGGVGVGPHLCALMYRSADPGEWGVLGSADHPRNWLAIMGACQLVRRDLFERVSGFDESYLVAMSDVALCLQIWKLGYRTAYAPQARLIHHEGATRGKSNPEDDIRRIADDIRLLGIDEDPYLHPEIDGHEAIPTLRAEGRPAPRDALAWNVETFGSLRPTVTSFDLCADDECLAVAGRPRDEVMWMPQEGGRVDDLWSAARWCIDLLRRRPDLRAAFPNALSEGGQGSFVQWLRKGGAREEGLAESGLAAVEALLAGDGLSARARQAFLSADLREHLPDGLLPSGRAQLFRWFMRAGRAAAGLRLEEVWWLLWLAAEQPALELMNAWRFTPGWQRLYPDADSVFGAPAFAAWFQGTFRCRQPWTNWASWPLQASPAMQVRQAYHAREHWRARFPLALQDQAQAAGLLDWLKSRDAGLPDAARRWCEAQDAERLATQLASPGMNVLGHFCYPSGLRVSVESLVSGMQLAGVDASLRDIRTDPMDEPRHACFDGMEVHDITLIHSQPEPFFEVAYERADLAERSVDKPYRIAYWYWEFDSVPASWQRQVAQVDEVWTATEFVAKGLRELVSVPVRTMFPGVRLNGYIRRPREHFGLASDRYTFLFTFHMMSIMERKNPLGLIRAFRRAFDPHERVSLVLKTSFGDRHPSQMEELRSAAAGHNIQIIDAVYSADEVLSLMDACDAYVSLHRSEGLGLTLAEAMLMGKPVIATNYSGNIDFMDEGNSLLVPYTLEPLGRPIPPYDADSRWAEPSLEAAAEAMRRLFDNRAFASDLGSRAKASALERLSVEAAGIRVARRLEEIRAGRKC